MQNDANDSSESHFLLLIPITIHTCILRLRFNQNHHPSLSLWLIHMASLSVTQIRGRNSVAGFTRPSLRTQRGRNRVGFLKVVGSAAETTAPGEPDLSVTVNGLHMPNPFVIGSGPPGTNYTVMKRAFDEGWGAVIAKTVSYSLLVFLLFSLIMSQREKKWIDDGVWVWTKWQRFNLRWFIYALWVFSWLWFW